MKKITQDEFIKRANSCHNNKYDYSKVVYINSTTKVNIICPIHGEFLQTPSKHLIGHGCPICGNKKAITERNRTQDEFLRMAENIHGTRYDYSKTLYKKNNKKVCIICHEKDKFGIEHGEFWQEPHTHLNGSGCPKCSRNHKYTTQEWVERAKIIHSDKYIYDNVEYESWNKKICIICPEHGEFYQTPHHHLKGHGCPLCANQVISEKKKLTQDEFISKAKIIHSDKYDYSKVEYVDCKTKIKIICPTHGEFRQYPSYHLNGNGCPFCNESHIEREVKNTLEKYKIEFNQKKHFPWLKNKQEMELDFYLPTIKVAIEVQGRQHYEPVSFGCKNSDKVQQRFNEQIKRDKKKKKLCEEHGIKMIYINFNEKKDIEKIILNSILK